MDPFMALLPDHTPEDADTGLPITQGVQSGILIGLTPIGELRALIGDREGGASGDCPLP
jgi:hypothetical protein